MTLLAPTLITLSLLTVEPTSRPAPAASASRSNAAAQGRNDVVITRGGSQPSRKGPPESFTGSVRIDWLFQAAEPSRASGAYVTFEPGARTAWHSHPLGQVLIVTAGLGRVQRWGGPVEEIRPGDVVWIQ